MTAVKVILFSTVSPSNSFISISDPWRAPSQLKKPFSSKGPRLALCVASGAIENQGHHQVCHARRKGCIRTVLRTTDANHECTFLWKRPCISCSKYMRGMAPPTPPPVIVFTCNHFLQKTDVCSERAIRASAWVGQQTFTQSASVICRWQVWSINQFLTVGFFAMKDHYKRNNKIRNQDLRQLFLTVGHLHLKYGNGTPDSMLVSL